MTNTPKRIVYILGAGATQAEVVHKGGEPINLMMKDSKKWGLGVSSRIRERTNIDRNLGIINEVDIEKLISLLAASGIEEYRHHAEELRREYFRELIESLSKAEILNAPQLATGLLELHNNSSFKKIESLLGIISLNHDNFFQIASQKVFKSINVGFKFRSDYFNGGESDTVPFIIHLHGSFNWENTLPIEIGELSSSSKYDDDMLWIPPANLKESKDYPYNKLTGLAHELLTKNCDILRIIGCSLSQNDWNLISLIFIAQYYQYHFNRKKCFKIELIIDQETGETIAEEYAYLKDLTPIGFLRDGKFDVFKDKNKKDRIQELSNPFKYWLKTKLKYHISKKEIDPEEISDTLKLILG